MFHNRTLDIKIQQVYEQSVSNLITVEETKCGNKRNPRGVATGERPVVHGEGEKHILVVNGAGALDDVLDQAN